MLRPNQVKEKNFQSVGRGAYLSTDVDEFFSEISSSYEQMFKENGELIRKISLLADKVNEYRKEEEIVKQALLNAQQMSEQLVANADADADGEDKVSEAIARAEEIISDAKNEANVIIDAANSDSKIILASLNKKIAEQRLVMEMLEKEALNFRTNLINAYREHLKLVDELPEIAEQAVENKEIEVEDFLDLSFIESENDSMEESKIDEENVLDFNIEELAEFEEIISDGNLEEFNTDEKTFGKEIIQIFEEIPIENEEKNISEIVLEEINVEEIYSKTEKNEASEAAESFEEEKKGGFTLDFSSISFDDDDEEITFDKNDIKKKSDYQTEEEFYSENSFEEDEIDKKSGNTNSFKDFFNKKQS